MKSLLHSIRVSKKDGMGTWSLGEHLLLGNRRALCSTLPSSQLSEAVWVPWPSYQPSPQGWSWGTGWFWFLEGPIEPLVAFAVPTPFLLTSKFLLGKNSKSSLAETWRGAVHKPHLLSPPLHQWLTASSCKNALPDNMFNRRYYHCKPPLHSYITGAEQLLPLDTSFKIARKNKFLFENNSKGRLA